MADIPTNDGLDGSDLLNAPPTGEVYTTGSLISDAPPVAPRKPWLNRRNIIIGLSFLLIALLAAGLIFWTLTRARQQNNNAAAGIGVASRYQPLSVTLDDLAKDGSLIIDSTPSLSINGQLKINNSLVIGPTSPPPANAVAGQIYYDPQLNVLRYYDGSSFASLLNDKTPMVKSLGGAGGDITLGSGLSLTNGQLSATAAVPSVTSVQGRIGSINFTSGGGIAINGTTLSNSGVTGLDGRTGNISLGTGLAFNNGALTNTGVNSLSSGSPSLLIANDGSGNLTITDSGGSSGVTSPGGTTNRLAKFTGAQAIGDSSISDNGTLVSITGDLAVSGGLTLGNLLSVGNGGTGAASLANNGILLGQGTGPITAVTAGGSGLCLMSTAGAPAFQACPGSGSVISLNSLTGALNIANASGSGATITIDDASTTQKGIAQFNGTNFAVGGGIVNTIQDIGTGATPTFAGVNATTGFQANGVSGASAGCNSGQFLENATVSGGIITAANCASAVGDGGITTIGAINTQVKSANGAVISGTNLYMQTADATNPGLVSTGTQTFAGDKTFNGVLTASSGAVIQGAPAANILTLNDSGGSPVATFDQYGDLYTPAQVGAGNIVVDTYNGSTASLVLRQNNPGATVAVAIIRGGATPGVGGDLLQLQTSTNTTVASVDAAGNINTTGVYKVSGTSGTTVTCSGGQLLQNTVVAGGIVTGGSCIGSGTGGVTTVGAIDSQTKSANGAVIVGTNLYMQTADASNPGIVSTGTQIFGGNKTFNGNVSVNQLTSTIATGTAPLVVSSTTKVTNLNADSLDGFDSTGFIQNTTTTQPNANIAIQSAADSSVTAFFQGRTNQTAATILIKQGATQSGDQIRLVDSNNVLQFSINQFGILEQAGRAIFDSHIGVGNPSAATTGTLVRVESADGTKKGLEIYGNFDQTANLASIYSGNTTGTVTNNLLVDRNQAGGTTTNGINISRTAGTLTNGLAFTGTIGTDITRGSGTLSINGASGINLQNAGGTIAGISSTGVNVTGLVNATTKYQINGTDGVAITCSGGQLAQNITTVGGIVTGGSCVASGGVSTIGAIDTQTKSANGAVIAGTSLYMQTADASNPGLVSTGTQTIAGSKTFTGATTLIKPTTNSTTALQVQNSGSTAVLTYDNTVNRLTLRSSSATSSALNILNSDGTTALEVRSGGSGQSNSFVGLNAGVATTSGSFNTGFGAGALQSVTSGQNNVAVGSGSLVDLASSNSNTAIGSDAANNTTGNYNTVIGAAALYTNSSGISNTAVGNSALYQNTGDYNTAIGSNAGYNLITGNYNTFIGTDAGNVDSDGFATKTNLTGTIVIGIQAQAQADNSLIMGGTGNQVVNVGFGTTKPENRFSVSPVVYGAGGLAGDTTTASQTGTTVTGTGTSWTTVGTVKVGQQIIFANGSSAYITAVNSNTSLTVDTSQTVASQRYRIHDPSLQVAYNGNTGIGTSSIGSTYRLDVQNANQDSLMRVYQNDGRFAETVYQTDNANFDVGVGGTNSGASDTGSFFVYDDNDGTYGMSIDGSGNVGLGNLAGNQSTTTLDVNGLIRVRNPSGETTAPTRANNGEFAFADLGTTNQRLYFRTNGTNYYINRSGTGDYSEYFLKQDKNESLKPGYLTTMDNGKVTKANQKNNILGVVSAYGTRNNDDLNDGLRGQDPAYANVGVLGQLPVIVTNEKGKIAAGDPIASSSKQAGLGTKTDRAGMIVGRTTQDFDPDSSKCTAIASLESAPWTDLKENASPDAQCFRLPDGTLVGRVLAYVNAQYYTPPMQGNDISNLQTDMKNLGASLQTKKATIGDLKVSGSATINGKLVVRDLTEVQDLQLDGHLITKGGKPTVTILAAAGTAASVSITGNDSAGTITLVAGDNSKADDLVKLSFSKAFGTTPQIVISPIGKASTALEPYVNDPSAKGFTFGSMKAPQAGKTYKFTYYAVQ